MYMVITIGSYIAIIGLIQLILSKNIDKFFNHNIFISLAIFMMVILAKAVFAHKLVHYKLVLFDEFFERVLFPIFIVVLVTRYAPLSVTQIFNEIPIWILIFLLADPFNFIKKVMVKSSAIQTGRFLRPLITTHPNSESDYIPTYLALFVGYLALWIR